MKSAPEMAAKVNSLNILGTGNLLTEICQKSRFDVGIAVGSRCDNGLMRPSASLRTDARFITSFPRRWCAGEARGMFEVGARILLRECCGGI